MSQSLLLSFILSASAPFPHKYYLTDEEHRMHSLVNAHVPSRKPLYRTHLTLPAFAGLVTAVSAWTIWGPSDVFPSEPDPKGGMYPSILMLSEQTL